eukprot:536415-Prorocentrum_minimum.AAC.5
MPLLCALSVWRPRHRKACDKRQARKAAGGGWGTHLDPGEVRAMLLALLALLALLVLLALQLLHEVRHRLLHLGREHPAGERALERTRAACCTRTPVSLSHGQDRLKRREDGTWRLSMGLGFSCSGSSTPACRLERAGGSGEERRSM